MRDCNCFRTRQISEVEIFSENIFISWKSVVAVYNRLCIIVLRNTFITKLVSSKDGNGLFYSFNRKSIFIHLISENNISGTKSSTGVKILDSGAHNVQAIMVCNLFKLPINWKCYSYFSKYLFIISYWKK